MSDSRSSRDEYPNYGSNANRPRTSTRRVLVEDDRAYAYSRQSGGSRSRDGASRERNANQDRGTTRDRDRDRNSNSARDRNTGRERSRSTRASSSTRESSRSRNATRTSAASSRNATRDRNATRTSAASSRTSMRSPRAAAPRGMRSGSGSSLPFTTQPSGAAAKLPFDWRLLVIAAAVLVLVIAVASCAVNRNAQAQREAEAAKELEAANAAAAAAALEPKTVSFLAVGDIVAHDEMIEQSKGLNGKAYDFNHVFEPMLSRLAPYDLTSVTQETPLVSDESKVGGYPVFGTPVEMGDAIVNAGFDIVTSATNHSMDQGIDGIFDTVNYWKNNHPEITLMGLHDKAEAADGVTFIERNGIKIAMTDLTYDLNGFVLPEGQEYAVDMLSELDAICKNVEAANSEADITICYVHMGEEYATTPSDEQREVAARLIDAGADVVLGSHVHVVQPMEEVTTSAGNKGIVYYSLGNYASNQANVENMLGGAAVLEITKTPHEDGSAETSVTSHSFVPVFCHYDYGTTQMYFLDDYTDELANTHFITQYGNPFTVDQVKGIWQDITGQSA